MYAYPKILMKYDGGKHTAYGLVPVKVFRFSLREYRVLGY